MSDESDSRPTRLLLVRHGESEGNRDRTFTQNPDVPLTPFGREQARAAAHRVAKGYRPSRIVASPFTRARQTAEIIAAVLGLSVDLDAAFREQSFGIFAGQPYEALLSDAARRLEAAGLSHMAAQVPSDCPRLVAFCDRFFRRQGAFPVLTLRLTS